MRGSILLVDDNPLVRATIANVMRRVGFSCDEAPNGQTAIDMTQKTRYDVVFMDLLMPGLSGEETIVRIKSIAPETEIVVLSVVSDESSIRQLFDTGASVYLRKPFDMEEIINIAKKLIRKKAKTL